MSSADPQQRTLRAVALLPARIGSTRLPRKVLLAETGLPLFAHTARAVARCPAIERVVVATDSDEVLEAGRALGLEVVSTSAEHESGTDRVREAYAALRAEHGEDFDVVLNVQADEPDVDPGDLAALIAAFADSAVSAATLAAPAAPGDAESPDVVKLVRDAKGDALYFSRSPLPCLARARPGAALEGAVLRHVGVYAFRPAALERFCDLGPARLEALENLEQLRWLEAGERMRVVMGRRAPRGVDTRADYDAFVVRARAARSSTDGGTPPTGTDPTGTSRTGISRTGISSGPGTTASLTALPIERSETR